MKSAVVYGAGSIGRGFIGQAFYRSGYNVCFLDVDEKLISEINGAGEYIVREVDGDSFRDEKVKGVRALNASLPGAEDEIARCDIMATSVGAGVLPKIAPVIAGGIARRARASGGPLNIILAENLMNAAGRMRGWVFDALSEDDWRYAEKNVGFVEASIGRMVPCAPSGRKNALTVRVEPYCALPLDKDAFVGGLPELSGAVYFSPFEFYVKRKLYIHNMGHALIAYMGSLKDYKYIWQAAADESVASVAREAMMNVAGALSREYGVELGKIVENVDDLLGRFKNKGLNDTIKRVARDPARKLFKDDRLTGAALYCLKWGFDASAIVEGACAAFSYYDSEDPSAVELNRFITKNGFECAIARFMGVEKGTDLYALVSERMRCGARKGII